MYENGSKIALNSTVLYSLLCFIYFVISNNLFVEQSDYFVERSDFFWNEVTVRWNEVTWNEVTGYRTKYQWMTSFSNKTYYYLGRYQNVSFIYEQCNAGKHSE